jgi:hypothetical protein
MQSEPGLLIDAESRPRGLSQLIRDALSAKAAPKVIIILAMLLTTSSLALGFSVDEYFQRVALLENSKLAGFERAPWELYTFTSGREMNGVLMEDGVFPWWTDPDLVISFFRPLSSLTLWLDHTLWPNNAALMHVQSMFWFALLLVCVSLVYREFSGSARIATLALLLYAFDDARAFLVGWIALRNAPVALAPAFLALIAHHRWRSGRGTRYAWLAPACLAIGLLGGEIAIAVCGYLLSYAVFLDRGTLWQRARSLLPYLAVLLPYRALYNAVGYGALHSGTYLDPGREPLVFLHGVLTRLPVLVFSQFAPLPADLWEIYPLIAPWLRPSVLACILVALGALWLLFRPLLRSSPVARFWALGCVLSTLPVCGTFPEDRLLTATALGGAGLLSMFLLALGGKTYPNPKRWTRAMGIAFIAIHAVLAPMVLTVRAQDIELVKAILDHADRSISREPQIADKTVIMLNPPINALGIFFPVFREAKGIALPGGFRFLATGESDLRVERLDARTLRLRPDGGFLFSASQGLFRSTSRKFQGGETITLSDMSFEVTGVTADGRPSEVVVRLQKPLEDSSLLWVQWDKHEYVPFRPPQIGSATVLPKVDPFSILELPEQSR